MKWITHVVQWLAICAVLASCSGSAGPNYPLAPEAAPLTQLRLNHAAAEAGNWLSHGRDYAEQRFSPLGQIHTDNVSQLGVAWVTGLDSNRGVEATPLVVDGVMYTTGSWSVIFALDAATGAVLWKHDPEVPRSKARHACCDVVNRGVAVYGDKVFVGTLDGRLLALDRRTGGEIWSTRTFDIELPYTITGAPRVIKNKVLIGNGGAEFSVRGFLAAYDVDTGERMWKFYTVPGNPAAGFENGLMEMAASTWNGAWWKLGGGGTVWDSMAYDPDLDLLYFGVGNGSPWNQRVRSPGGGDNLFLSSIVAIKPETGEYIWHYQTTPGDTWDYTATQSIILADVEIEGQARKILMQAPKNGFFYVLDRATGELLSAEPFVPATWASHVDRVTGRPVETPESRYEGGSQFIMPGPLAAHNWHPMSYSPNTGFAYLPAQELPFAYADWIGGRTARVIMDTTNTMVQASLADVPPTRAEQDALRKQLTRGHLAAWDPVAQKEAWRVQYERAWNGGTLATAGNLVFQGTAEEEFAAYDARTGALLWSLPINSPMFGGPISYEVNGEQYIAASAGWGTVYPMFAAYLAGQKGAPQAGHMVAFKLGGTVELNIESAPLPKTPRPPRLNAEAETIEQGRMTYNRFCIGCHGESVVSSGVTPDLRRSSTLKNRLFDKFVLEGISTNGMPGYGEVINKQEADALRQYIIQRAWLAYEDERASDK